MRLTLLEFPDIFLPKIPVRVNISPQSFSFVPHIIVAFHFFQVNTLLGLGSPSEERMHALQYLFFTSAFFKKLFPAPLYLIVSHVPHDDWTHRSTFPRAGPDYEIDIINIAHENFHNEQSLKSKFWGSRTKVRSVCYVTEVLHIFHVKMPDARPVHRSSRSATVREGRRTFWVNNRSSIEEGGEERPRK